MHFFNLKIQIGRLLESHKLELLQFCETLKASNTQDINLFSTSQKKELSECDDTFILLSPLITWSNHSILKVLVGCCGEAVKLLDEFDSKLNLLQPITLHPVPFLCADMIPSDTSTYTILAVGCKVELYDSSLQYIYDIQSAMIEKCDITQHCLQLLAVRSDPTIFYWTIPQCVVHLINTNVPLHSEYLYSRGILEVSVYPDLLLTTGDDVCMGSLVFVCEDEVLSKEVTVNIFLLAKYVHFTTIIKHRWLI